MDQDQQHEIQEDQELGPTIWPQLPVALAGGRVESGQADKDLRVLVNSV